MADEKVVISQKEALTQYFTEEERTVLEKLISGKLLDPREIEKYLRFRINYENNGAVYLGDILVEMGYASKNDIDAFVEENRTSYLNFCDTLAERGFLTEKQVDTIRDTFDQTGKSAVEIVNELGIMTKNNFCRMFEASSATGMKLGEWLINKKIIDRQQLNHALKMQKVYRLEDYLVYRNLISPQVLRDIKFRED